MQKQKRLCVDLLHAFGSVCSNKYTDCIAIIQEDKTQSVIYPCGKYIAKKSIETNHSAYIKLTSNIQAIDCICVSPNKTEIAVCQRLKNQETVQLSIYNLKGQCQKKFFKYVPRPDMVSNSFKVLAFAPAQPKLMVALTTAPDNLMMFIDISKTRTYAETSFRDKQITKVAINPTNSYMVSVSGRNLFKILRVQEQLFKIQHETFNKLPKNRKFTDHVWYEKNKILLGTEKGQIFIIENNNQVKKQIQCAFADPQEHSVTVIKPFSKGFMIGSDKGLFAVYLKNQDMDEAYDQDTLVLIRKFSVAYERRSQITCMDINPRQDTMAVAFSNNDVATIDLSQIIPPGYQSIQTIKQGFKDRQIFFQYVHKGFHGGAITAMDVCTQRPLVATCSKYDNTIRIWNYKNPGCQLVRQFALKNQEDDEFTKNALLSLAFHPSGYYLAVGCPDKIRFFHVLNSKLHRYRQIVIRGCTQLKFSNGGHLLAAACPKPKSSFYMINIYQAYTLQFVTSLKGHNGIITELVFTTLDQNLISVSADGTCIQWKTGDWQNPRIYCQNAGRLNSVIHNHISKSLIVCGAQGQKNIVRQLKVSKDQIIRKTFMLNYKISRLKWIISQENYSGIIGGTQDGFLNIYPNSFDGLPQQSVSGHLKEIVKIECSPCGRYIFSAGQDGMLLVFQVLLTNRDGYPVSKLPKQLAMIQKIDINPFISVVDDQLADIVLLHRNDITSAIKQTKALKLTIQDLQMKIDQIKQDDAKKHQKQINDQKLIRESEVKKLNQIISQLRIQLQETMKKNQDQNKSENQKFLSAVGELQSIYEQKLYMQAAKFQRNQQKLIEEQILHTQQVQQLNKKHSQAIELLKNQFNKEMRKVQKCYKSMSHTMSSLQKVYKTRLEQVEDQYQKEFQELQHTLTSKQNHNQKKLSEQENSYRSLKQKYNSEMTHNNRLLQEKQDQDHILRQMKKQIEQLKFRVSQKGKQLTEKQQIIKSKDAKIGQYLAKISDLQKSKHVLSFRVTQMRKSLEPKEAQIQKLKEELQKLQNQFQNMLVNMQKHNEKNQSIVKINQTLEEAIRKQMTVSRSKDQQIHKITMDIYNCVKSQDPKKALQQLKRLYMAHVEKLEVKLASKDQKSVDQMGQQILALQNQISGLTRSNQKMMIRRNKDLLKKTKENAELIYQLNNMRKLCKKHQSKISTINKLNRQLMDKIGSSQQLQNQQGIQVAQEVNKTTDQQVVDTVHKNVTKGKIIKGTNFDSATQSSSAKHKISQLVGELQLAQYKIGLLQNENLLIRERIRSHLQAHKCRDYDLQTYLQRNRDDQ